MATSISLTHQPEAPTQTRGCSPPGRCSPASRRRWRSAGRPACSPYTSRSRRSLCVRPSPAGRCPASGLCRGEAQSQPAVQNSTGAAARCRSTMLQHDAAARCRSTTPPVDDSLGVQELEAADDLGCVEPAGQKQIRLIQQNEISLFLGSTTKNTHLTAETIQI